MRILVGAVLVFLAVYSVPGELNAQVTDTNAPDQSVSSLPTTDILRARYESGLGEYNKANFGSAFETLLPLAEQGYADAQYLIGVMFNTGRGTAQDAEIALRWISLAAEQGHPAAQENIHWLSRDYAARRSLDASVDSYPEVSLGLDAPDVDDVIDTVLGWPEVSLGLDAPPAQQNSTPNYTQRGDGTPLVRPESLRHAEAQQVSSAGHLRRYDNPRFLPTSVYLTSRIPRGDDLYECIFTDGVRFLIPANVNCFRYPASPNYAQAAPPPSQQNSTPNYTQRGDGTPEDVACRNFGLQLGTSDYSTCRAQMAQLRIQQQQYELQVQQYQQQMAEVERERRRQRGLAMLQFAAGMANSTSPYFSDSLAAGGRAVLGIAEPPSPQNPPPTVINLPGRRPMICSYAGNVINCN